MLSLAAAGTKKASIVISKSNYIVFLNRNICFLEGNHPKILKNKSVLFLFIKGCAKMQYPSCDTRHSGLRAAEPI